MENSFQRIKKIAKRVLPQSIDPRMSSTSAKMSPIMASIGNDVLSDFAISASTKCLPEMDKIVDENNFDCQLSDSDDDCDAECSDLEHYQDPENLIEASTSILSSMKALDSINLQSLDPETKARLQVLFEASGLVKINPLDGGFVSALDGGFVSEALNEAANALIKMKEEETLDMLESERHSEAMVQHLIRQCSDSSKMIEDGESLLPMATSGYYKLYQYVKILLAGNVGVEDRGSKGDCTPLMEAAAGGYVDIIQLLLRNNACVNAKSAAGNTALHYAASGGHEKAVQVLINAGAQVEAANDNGHTPLMEAASVGHIGVARLLVENGADVNTQSREFKESSLSLASFKGHAEMVEYLINSGADIEQKTDEMHTALMEACIEGFVDVVKILIDRGAEVNMIPEGYETPLTLASCGGHLELVKLLISKGAMIEQRNDEGCTPLIEAAREGHTEIVTLLLEYGADVNAITPENGDTALTLACNGGFMEVAEALIQEGADLELGKTPPLLEAAQEGHLYLVKYLLDAGADVNAIGQEGQTALLLACCNGHTSVAEILLSAGSNLEHESNNEKTPLMMAAHAGHLTTVQFLVNRGASVNKATTNNEHTALSLACFGGHVKLVEFLLQSGANAAHKLKDGSTMLIEAAKGGHAQVVSLLLDWSVMLSSDPSLSDKSKTNLPGVSLPTKKMISAQGKKVWEKRSNAEGCSSLDKVQGSSPPSKLGPPNSLDEVLSVSSSSSSTSPVDSITVSLDDANSALCNKGTVLSDLLSKADFDLLSTCRVAKVKEQLRDILSSIMKVDFWKLSAEEQSQKKNQIKKALLLLKDPSEQLFCGDEDDDDDDDDDEDEGDDDDDDDDNGDKKAKPSSEVDSPNKKDCGHQHLALLLSKMPDESNSLSPGTTKDRDLKMKEVSFRQIKTTDSQRIGKNKEAVRQEGDGCSGGIDSCSGGIDSAVHDLSGSSSISSSSSSSSSSSVSEVEKFEDACFCCCSTEKPEASIERGESIASLVEGRKRACLDHFENESAFNLKRERNSLCEDGFSKNANPSSNPHHHHHHHPSNSYNPAISIQNRIIAKGHRKLPQQPKVGTSDQQVQAPSPSGQEVSKNLKSNSNSTNKTPDVEDQRSSPLKHKQISNSEDVQKGDCSRTCIHHKVPGIISNGNSTSVKTQQQHQEIVQKAKLFQQQQQTQVTSKQHVIPNVASSLSAKVDSLSGALAKFSAAKSKHCFPSSKISQLGQGASNGTTPQKNPAGGVAKKASAAREHSVFPAIEVNAQTEANHDTALTLASAGGHSDLVLLLLRRGAAVEHRDKKGFTSLILAAAAGHLAVVDILLDQGADIEAQLEQTKDTALSLACSGGRHEVVETLLKHGVDREHRNASDYTPLCLAASGGHVNVVRMLLVHGAEINSRTSSRLGISPLMLASMNGHSNAVSLLLDMGGDVNAQIETNKNTALSLACFQGRHEVVALLADRKANLEHRVKKGCTPLMEAAGGGYVEVGRVLLDRGADVSAVHGSSTRDTALTIAADKGHYRFVELLLTRGAPVDAKNKKGHTALWLACNGGHLEVVQLLVGHRADSDACDNRRTSCLMAAFKKGHVKVVRWLVRHITQLPSDQECGRCLAQIGIDKDLFKKCQQCMEIILNAKERQAAEANRNANSLLLELAQEQSLVESRKAAAIRKREKRKQKKKVAKTSEGSKETDEATKKIHDTDSDKSDDSKTRLKSNFKSKPQDLQVDEKINDESAYLIPSKDFSNGTYKNEFDSESSSIKTSKTFDNCSVNKADQQEFLEIEGASFVTVNKKTENNQPAVSSSSKLQFSGISDLDDFGLEKEQRNLNTSSVNNLNKGFKHMVINKAQASSGNLASGNTKSPRSSKNAVGSGSRSSNGPSYKNKEEGWKEVSRKCKKMNVPGKCISRIIGRGGCNINAIREASGAHIDLDKMKNCDDGMITIKGSQESTQLAVKLLEALINDCEKDIEQLIALHKTPNSKSSKQAGVVTTNSDNSAQSKDSSKSNSKPACLMSIAVPLSLSKTFSAASTVSKSNEPGISKVQQSTTPKSVAASKSHFSDDVQTQGVWKTFVNENFKTHQDSLPVESDSIAEEKSSALKNSASGSCIGTPGTDRFSFASSGCHNDNADLATPQQPKSSFPQFSPPSYNFGGGDFSPFNNLLSKITETLLQGKSKETKKDFASVAASCLANGSSSMFTGSTLLHSSSPKISTPDVVDSALQAKAPGFRPAGFGSTNLQRRSPHVMTSVPSPVNDAMSSAVGYSARRLNFSETGETSPFGIGNMRNPHVVRNQNIGTMGVGISCSVDNSTKNSFSETSPKFFTSCDSSLNPNAPNFTIGAKNFEIFSSMLPPSSPHHFVSYGGVTPSKNNFISGAEPFNPLIGKERFQRTFMPPVAPPVNQQSSFMFNCGLTNPLWRYDPPEPPSSRTNQEFFNNLNDVDPSHQYPNHTTEPAYFFGSSFLTGEAAPMTSMPKESHHHQHDGLYNSADECTFGANSFNNSRPTASSAFMPPLFPPLPDPVTDQAPPFGMYAPHHSGRMYPPPGIDLARDNSKTFFNSAPSFQTFSDPQLLGWQQ